MDNKVNNTPPKVKELKALNARLLWHVKINKKYCPVYDIQSREHYGRDNGDVPTWWIQTSDYDDAELHPYSDRFTNRICFEYNFRQFNSSKMKWDELCISRGVHVEIKANDKPFLSFTTRDMDFAMAKAQYKVVQAMEHPYDFLNPEKEKGRKIYYYGLPATIKPMYDTWEIGIIPDYSTGIDKQTWWEKFKERRTPVKVGDLTVDEREDEEIIWGEIDSEREWFNHGDALSDGNINWFRKD